VLSAGPCLGAAQGNPITSSSYASRFRAAYLPVFRSLNQQTGGCAAVTRVQQLPDWAQWWSNPAHPGAGSGFGARHGKPARRVLSSVEPMSVSARWMGSPSTSSRSSLVRTSAATHCGRRRHTLRFLLTAGQHQSRVPAARPPASRGSESVRGQATASDQPRDDRVRVPHLARAQLVATTAPSETTPRSRASPRPTGACSITNLPSGTCTMRAEW
jgi:hypothetical protein